MYRTDADSGGRATRQNAEPGAIFWLITNGVSRRGMPVWSKLPEAQRWQIVKFIKSLKTATPNEGARRTQSESAKNESVSNSQTAGGA
jgi:hypothetical protein